MKAQFNGAFLAAAALVLTTACGTPATPEDKKSGAPEVSAAKAKLERVNKAIQELEGADVASLTKGLKDKDRRVRRAAANQIKRRGIKDDAVIEALIPVLCDHDKKTRGAAQKTLVTIGEPAVAPLIAGFSSKNAVSKLTYNDKGKSISIRLMIKKTLVKIGEPAVAKLIEALDAENQQIRRNVSGALGRMGPVAKASVPRLLKSLEDPNWGVRRNSIADASKIDPGNPAVKAAAEKLLKDEDERVVKGAKKALERIETFTTGGAAKMDEKGKGKKAGDKKEVEAKKPALKKPAEKK